ncbi:MAG: DOMON-like domain-containing protein [Candidatus Latescibacteria bacterium]|nr:DOMON-like domain-containing protein [Candidatus Latescibacterota bacterium]
MSELSVDLVPFVAAEPPLELNLSGVVARDVGFLRVCFRLQGNPALVRLPVAAGSGTRRDSLWLGTCFEAFVAVEGEHRYAEVNLATSRDWNVYLFEEYRCGMRPDHSVSDLMRSTVLVDGILTADFSLPLTSLAPGDRVLEVGLAAVIRHADGRLSHWALAHPGERPDFHRREGFLLRC